ncbi:hypothetical protein KRR40_16900 [Niabella defluvii]|nr:hypothetical protein KRR40_16900 [Niabella sp. I65]
MAAGTLPVGVCTFKQGDGKLVSPSDLTYLEPIGDERFAAVDSIAIDGIKKKKPTRAVLYWPLKTGKLFTIRHLEASTTTAWTQPG